MKLFASIFAQKQPEALPLCPNLPLPPKTSREQILEFLLSVHPADAPPAEMENYCRSDFARFLYTYGLTDGLSGRCLELGSNPYFTTMLLKTFTHLELTLANYFGEDMPDKMAQTVNYTHFKTRQAHSEVWECDHFNIENSTFPYDDKTFDLVLFCEIIEHLLMDPVSVLMEIKRILRPNGTLILTTPNVARLENVARIIQGENIYDPYSGYGPYGRHNREYNKHELAILLQHCGYTPQIMFTADVHDNRTDHFLKRSSFQSLVQFRAHDLGQYIFIKAINDKTGNHKKPAILYRSYPVDQIVA